MGTMEDSLLKLARQGFQQTFCRALLENFLRESAKRWATDRDTVVIERPLLELMLRTVEHVTAANAEYFFDEAGSVRWDVVGRWIQGGYPPIETIRPEGVRTLAQIMEQAP